MAKWADYGISAVRFNSANTHIDKVKIHTDNDDTMSSASEVSRSDVINAIKKGTTFVTILKDGDGKWQKGASVFITAIGGNEYIKTVKDGTPKDNLDNLPRF